MTSTETSPNIQLGQLMLTADALAPVADSVGSQHFLRTLFECVTRFADCDTLHLERTRFAPHARSVEWIGSYGGDPAHLRSVMELYYDTFAKGDPTFARVAEGEDIELMQVSAQALKDVELRSAIYDVAGIHDECVVLRASHGDSYLLSVCRGSRLPAFSLKELSVLKHLGQIVLPLAALHARLVGVVSLGGVRIAPPDPLAALLMRHHVGLSPREISVCAAFVKGMTTQAVAETMGVKQSSVETYAKRAFVKLGVSSRRQLLSLVHSLNIDRPEV